MDLRIRESTPEDIFAIMSLYQKVGSTFSVDSLFLDFERIRNTMQMPTGQWLSGYWEGRLGFAAYFQLDEPHGLAKISRIVVDPTENNPHEALREGIKKSVDFILEKKSMIDIVYTTTFTLAPQFQKVTLEVGFKILGIFPNARGVDRSRLNGLTVYYRPGVLETKRIPELKMHKTLLPFFRIAQRQANLPDEVVGVTPVLDLKDCEVVKDLELIKAPKFVAKKFEALKSQQSLAVSFYPFYHPDTLICDPDQTCEVYVKNFASSKFAAIIGEYLTKAVDPVFLYRKVLDLLHDQGVTYVEVINDAADVLGTEAILESGFTPTAYIPGFKLQGDKRRDFVVFGKSFEYFVKAETDIPRGFIEFFRQYMRLERRNFFPTKPKSENQMRVEIESPEKNL